MQPRVMMICNIGKPPETFELAIYTGQAKKWKYSLSLLRSIGTSKPETHSTPIILAGNTYQYIVRLRSIIMKTNRFVEVLLLGSVDCL